MGLRIGPKKQKEAAPEGWFSRSAFESVKKKKLHWRAGSVDRSSNRSKKAKGSCAGGLVQSIGRSAFESVRKKQKEAAPEGWFGRSAFESVKNSKRKLRWRAGSVDWIDRPSNRLKKTKGSCAGGLVRSIGLRIGPKKQKEAAPEGWFGRSVDRPSNR